MPACAVIGDVYRLNAARYRDKPAFVMPDGRKRSFADLYDRVLRLCGALLSHGLTPGHRVGILARNRIEYVEGYGVSTAGFIALPLNWRLSPRELEAVLQDAEPCAVLADPEFRPMIEQMQHRLPFIKHIISFDEDYEDFISATPSTVPQYLPSQDDTACLLYTSGTTGNPKGAEPVSYTHLTLPTN